MKQRILKDFEESNASTTRPDILEPGFPLEPKSQVRTRNSECQDSRAEVSRGGIANGRNQGTLGILDVVSEGFAKIYGRWEAKRRSNTSWKCHLIIDNSFFFLAFLFYLPPPRVSSPYHRSGFFSGFSYRFSSPINSFSTSSSSSSFIHSPQSFSIISFAHHS
uniref:Uncharacterized protein n=1 Tax=Caenorhabditis tropicalis TaxID=1561998 RepID=A0A1I7UJ78_9PELO